MFRQLIVGLPLLVLGCWALMWLDIGPQNFIAKQEVVDLFKTPVLFPLAKDVKKIEEIKKQKTTSAVIMVQYQPEFLQNKTLRILLPDNRVLTLKDPKVAEVKESKNYLLTWRDKDKSVLITFTNKGTVGYGVISLPDGYYVIRPLTLAVAAIVKVDQSKFPKD